MSAGPAAEGQGRPARQRRSCHERALGLLAVRARSRRELERRLLQAGFEPAEVDAVLVRLERAGLIDDRAFASQLAEHHFVARRSGRRAVRAALLRHGVAAEVAESVVAEGRDAEPDRALELALERARRYDGLEQAKAYGRLTSFLVRRGYAPDVARSAAREALGVDPFQ